MDESCESCDIRRVEDNDNVLHIRAILLDEVAELSCNLTVSLEKVFAGHSLFAWSATGRDDVLCILESNLRIYCPGNVCTRERAMIHFFSHTVDTRLKDIIEADVWGESEHKCCLCHIGTDHSACTDDEQFFV